MATLLLLAVASTAWANDFFEKNGIYYGTYDDGTERVFVNGSSHSGSIVIPSQVTYEGTTYKVTLINHEAFLGRTDITSVHLPNTIQRIFYAAFQNCTNLTSINLPSSIEYIIDDMAFSGCSSLTSITIPNSVTSIGRSAFDGCSSLTSVTIPNSVTYIGERAFQGCSSLNSITIPSSVTNIGQYAFSGCSGKLSIDCDIVANMFEYSPITEVTIGNHVKNIGERAFKECLDLTKVSFGDNLDSISFNAFENCRLLTSVTLPNSLRKMENSAFNGCWSLKEATIGSGIQFVGWDAFYNCNKLRTVTCKAKTVPETGSTAFISVPQNKATLHVPLSAIEQYKQADVWKEFGTIRPLTYLPTETITLPSTCTLGIGGQRQLIATIEPEYANWNVKWSSSNENIATVDATGMVTPLSTGNVTITAKTIDGTNLSTTCQATVIASPLYSYEDFTNKVNTRWSWPEGDFVGGAAPQVTTNDGRTTAAWEDYKNYCDMTGDLFSQTVEVPNGIYRVELYAAAAYTPDRGFSSEATEGDGTAVYAYVDTNLDRDIKYLPVHIASDFNSTGIDLVTFEDIEVKEGVITIGMVKEKPYTNWHVIQIKGLTRRVDVLEHFDDFANGKVFPYALEQKKTEAISTIRSVLASAADNSSKMEAINKAYRPCAESSALLEGLKGAVNMTSRIINPKAESGTNGWETINGYGSHGSIESLSGQPWTDGSGQERQPYFDGCDWGASFWDVTFKQTVTLPAGHYQLTVMGRAEKNVVQTLFAGDVIVEMPHIGNTGGMFNNGWNQTSLEFELEEETAVELGVKGVNSVVHNWMSFSDFRLMKFPDVPTAIAFPTEDDFDASIFDITGCRLAVKPQHGLYIQNGKKYFVK